MKMKSAGRGSANGMKISVSAAREPPSAPGQRARPTNTPPRGRIGSTEKMRVTVYKCSPDSPLPANEPGRALIVPDTWQEFLNAVSRKLNVNRIISVETDGGTILEELDEIMAGDKLVIRCAEEAPPPRGRNGNGHQEEVGEVDNMEEIFRRNVLDVLGDESDHGAVKPDSSLDHTSMNNMLSSMSQMSLRGKGPDNEMPRNVLVGQQENNNGNQMNLHLHDNMNLRPPNDIQPINGNVMEIPQLNGQQLQMWSEVQRMIAASQIPGPMSGNQVPNPGFLPNNLPANNNTNWATMSPVARQYMMQQQNLMPGMPPQQPGALQGMNMNPAFAIGQFGGQSNGRRSHEQARFSPLVQILRDHLVATNVKEMDVELISQKLAALVPDWQTRLGVNSVADYINEAAQAGLVQVQQNGKQILASIRGNREMGIVKWVKESYGFIQSASHAEDLFYHGSEVRANRLLMAGDEVEFLVVRNPFTGKLNATQIYLINGADSPVALQGGGSPAGSSALAPLATAESLNQFFAGENNDEINQFIDRMSSMGFSIAQIEESLRSFHANISGGSNFNVGVNGPYGFGATSMAGKAQVIEPNKEPWLFKTKMCKFWPNCPRGAKCWFAHGDDELRKPNSVAYMLSTQGKILDQQQQQQQALQTMGMDQRPLLNGMMGNAESQFFPTNLHEPDQLEMGSYNGGMPINNLPSFYAMQRQAMANEGWNMGEQSGWMSSMSASDFIPSGQYDNQSYLGDSMFSAVDGSSSSGFGTLDTGLPSGSYGGR